MSSQPTDAAPPTTAKIRRNLVLSIAAVALLSSLIVSTQAASATGASPPVSKATIVLLHGAWADASSFAPVTERLQRDGYTVLAPPNPLRGLGSDAGYLAAFLQQRTTGPVILVGHSYGGAVISNAALADPDVKALVYVDGFVPTRTNPSWTCRPARAAAGHDRTLRHRGLPGRAGRRRRAVLQDRLVPGRVRQRPTEQYGPPARRLPAIYHLLRPRRTFRRPGLEEFASWYVLGTQDHAIAPSLQRFMAQRAGSRITTVDAGHLPMLSQPRTVERVIVTAARATQ